MRAIAIVRSLSITLVCWGRLASTEDCRSLCDERVGVTDVHANGNILVQGPVPTTAFCREVACTVDYNGLDRAIGAAIARQTAFADGASSGLTEGAYARLAAVARASSPFAR